MAEWQAAVTEGEPPPSHHLKPPRYTPSMEAGAPWVEKYRPKTLGDVILSDVNRRIFNTILERGTMPHILAHGPPGTGKTTAILNLVREFVRREDCARAGMVIHLNASDDRGIEVIRNHVARFSQTMGVFKRGTKFVILDEADYMTKGAQLELRQVIQQADQRVRFCLICNYVARLATSLQDELVALRFDRLPPGAVTAMLRKICEGEHVPRPDAHISRAISAHGSDIRRVLNRVQVSIAGRDAHHLGGMPVAEDKLQLILEALTATGETWRASSVSRLLVSVAHESGHPMCSLLSSLLGYMARSQFHGLSPSLVSSMESLCSMKGADAFVLADCAAHRLSECMSISPSTRARRRASQSPAAGPGGGLPPLPTSTPYSE